MGRTIPSFRLVSADEEREWKVFRNALDKSDRACRASLQYIAVLPTTNNQVVYAHKHTQP